MGVRGEVAEGKGGVGHDAEERGGGKQGEREHKSVEGVVAEESEYSPYTAEVNRVR